MLRVIKRDGRIKDFDFDRVANAIYKAYRDIYGGTDAIHDILSEYDSVIMELHDDFDMLCSMKPEMTFTVEDIQDHAGISSR